MDHIPEPPSLRASGAIVRDQWLRASRGARVLIVAASDVDLVERVLGPRLPHRLCVVASRYSAEQVRDVEATFTTRHRQWQFESWATGGLDHDGQPFAWAELHEAAHPLLHGELDAVEDQQHRGVCETEAESDADVLATFLGLDVERLIGELHRRLVPRPVDRPHRGRRQHPARGRQRRRPVARDGERGRAGA
jgi:hypothetical protein